MKLLCLLSAVLFSVGASAAESKNSISEFQEHAMGGQFELTPHLEYASIKAELGATSIKGNGYRLGTEVEYGVMDRLSVGADVTYSSITVDVTPKTKSSGLEDVVLFTRGSSEMGMGRLAYGLNVSLALENAKTETNGDTNSATGGFALRPYVGYEMMAGPGTWGAQINYAWLGERTSEAAGVETKTKDGNTLGLATFYEYGINEMAMVGGSINYAMSGDTKTAGVSNNDKSNDLTLAVYGDIKAGENMSVLPKLSYITMSPDDETVNAKTKVILVGAALRWMM